MRYKLRYDKRNQGFCIIRDGKQLSGPWDKGGALTILMEIAREHNKRIPLEAFEVFINDIRAK